MTPAGNDARYAYSGPCAHCGHLPDEHGENYACIRVGYRGNSYAEGRLHRFNQNHQS